MRTLGGMLTKAATDMLDNAVIDMVLAGPLHLVPVDHAGRPTGGPVTVRLPDGTTTDTVPLDLPCTPDGDVPATYVLLIGEPGRPRWTSAPIHIAATGDSFTMPARW